MREFQMRISFHRFWFMAVLFLLNACGGGGGGGNGSPSSSVTVAGTVTYTSYQPDVTTGLDYGSPTEKPIRGAVIELQNSSGTVLDSDNTSAAGNYSLTAPANTSISIIVKAALGSPASPHTKIVDNTSGAALYAMTMAVTTGTSAVTQNFNANSGWDGTSYSGTRTAAPFSILDTIYAAQQMVLAADSGASFPTLTVNWSKNNKPTEGDLALGEIGTSHYRSDNLYILGAEGLDTDEYDTHIIAHEWGHYFEAKFSRSDHIGGGHSPGDILDPTVAFGEGFGNAFSGMVMNDPLYVDTGGISQATVDLDFNLETDSVLDTDTDTNGTPLDGFYSETSIQEILYDLYDSGASDDDAIGLGFAPLYEVLVNGQKTTPAFTSIFSFLHYLKQANPASSSAITSLAMAENIGAGDEYEATSFPLYTNVPFDGSIVTIDVDGYPLQTWNTYGPITTDNPPGNKLFNRLYFKVKATAAGCYTLEVTPTDGGDLVVYATDGSLDDQGPGVAETTASLFTLNEEGVFAVGSLGGESSFTVRLYSTPSAC
jgi:hypothetical protein